MKVVTAQEMSRVERISYHEGASEEAFMEKAGGGVAGMVQEFLGKHHLRPDIVLLCGRGNNAGDAYVAGRLLREGGFRVRAYSGFPLDESSPLCQLQGKRFEEVGGTLIHVNEASQINLERATLIVDGILGTGFHGEVGGIFGTMIDVANASELPILSIDIPSGIDGNTGEVGGRAINATKTLFLGMPKTGCFLGEAWNYTGRVELFDFGLGMKYLAQAEEDFILLNDDALKQMLPKVERVRHKYEAGYVVGLGGSPGMPGAPMLTCDAAMRSGAGIIRLLHPKGMEAELADAPYELIREGWAPGDTGSILKAMERASGLFIGPGMGTAKDTAQLLKELLPKIEKPCVIDAEALTLVATHSLPLPKNAILTPHHGEMKRLLDLSEEISIQELHKQVQDYVEKNDIALVLKGAPTFIFSAHSEPLVCPRGDPGMATAGSGDVLTGMIAAFLSQGLSPLDAACVGVYVHAWAGELAAERLTSYSMVASDITEHISEVFASL